MRKVVTFYKALSQAEFGLFLTTMLQSMTGNTHFPNPTIALNIIAGKQTDWKIELNHSKQGNRQATVIANMIQDELIELVRINGDYINNTANGNVGMLETSGYKLAKERVYKKKPQLKIVQGEFSGTGEVVLHAVPGAKAYLVELAADPLNETEPELVWNRLKMSTRCTIPFSGLEPGRKYWAKFCYVTVKGEADYCQPRSFRVL